jgi:hypothetical protein
MVISALLSAIHMLALALGVVPGALSRVRCRGRRERLLGADNLWGIAAGLSIGGGLERGFLGGRT